MALIQYIENIAHTLPKREQEILFDMVVNCDTISDMVTYKKSLSTQDRYRFDTLLQLLELERIDSDMNSMKNFPDAIDIITKVMYDNKK